MTFRGVSEEGAQEGRCDPPGSHLEWNGYPQIIKVFDEFEMSLGFFGSDEIFPAEY